MAALADFQTVFISAIAVGRVAPNSIDSEWPLYGMILARLYSGNVPQPARRVTQFDVLLPAINRMLEGEQVDYHPRCRFFHYYVT